MSEFTAATEAEVKTAILTSSDSTCLLDFVPTKILKSCLPALLPPITTLINLCLSESRLPADFKHALVTPLLKKDSLPKDNLSNYRPISNLNFMSKILEKIIYNRIVAHLNSFLSLSPFQSAYKKFHSVETALLKIQNDLLLAIDRKQISALVLLDMSAAFDTVDHEILLSRLHNNFGISGSALDLITSYLSDRTHSVLVNSHICDSCHVSTGVPQGSVLGPLLFSLYTTPLTYLLSESSLPFHLYADDTQSYISFTSDESIFALNLLSTMLNKVHAWLSCNRLSLNPAKTEFLIIGSRQQRSKLAFNSFTFAGTTVALSDSVRNLGVTFDPDLSLSKHIASVVKSSHFTIRQIRQIRSSLDLNSAICLANALVSSKLDFCNSLFYNLPNTSINKLQLVQNALARAVCPSTKKFDHITPILKKLHWLPIRQRISYKILVITYKTLQYGSPSYLFDLLVPHRSCFNSRSNGQHLLDKPCPLVKSSTGRRSFSFAAPTLWNSLPLNIKISSTLSSFCSKLKTFLYPP